MTVILGDICQGLQRFAQTALMACSLLVMGVAEANDGRLGYGASAYPIWSELSYFERSSLADVRQARAGDPEALLALYLVASGTRELSQYERVWQRLEDFKQYFDKQVVDESNHWLIGQLLNQHMHRHFFSKEANGEAPRGYSIDQSRLMGIFETGHFNCISASLLYGVLARQHGLDASGVLLPSHAFVALSLPDGREIDVETTSPGGYDLAHDAEFYQNNNNDWFASRGLQPATYQDYLNREKVPLTGLASRNMLNQHTTAPLMAESDAYRLAEISAYLDPGYGLAQQKRLHFYSKEIHQLLGDSNWPVLERFFATTYESVAAAERRFSNHEVIRDQIYYYWSGAMVSYAQAGDTERTLDLIGKVVAYAHRQPDQRATAETRVAASVGLLLNQMAERKEFNDGLLVLSLVEGHLQNPEIWPELVSRFYLRWAQHRWEENDWPGVVELVEEVIGLPAVNQDPPQGLKIAAGAYHNWVLQEIENRDMRQAQALVHRCQAHFGKREVCDSAQRTLRQATAELSRDS